VSSLPREQTYVHDGQPLDDDGVRALVDPIIIQNQIPVVGGREEDKSDTGGGRHMTPGDAVRRHDSKRPRPVLASEIVKRLKRRLGATNTVFMNMYKY
jgi:hypothetical protein